MINPFKIASLAYNVLLSQNENAAELYEAGDIVRASMDSAEESTTAELIAMAMLCDELLRQVNNFDQTESDSQVKQDLELLYEICNGVSQDEDIKKVLGK